MGMGVNIKAKGGTTHLSMYNYMVTPFIGQGKSALSFGVLW